MLASWLKQFETRSKPAVTTVCMTIVITVGLMDYVTGYETFLFIFYLIAVFSAVWFSGISLGVLISVLSVAVWVSTHIAAGERYTSYFVPFGVR